MGITHVLLWTVGPALEYHTLMRDTLEGVAWGFMWQWGYDKHPPLAAWLSAASFELAGNWGVFFAAQLCVLAAFWAVWKLASEVLDPWPAVLAALLLEGLYYYNASSIVLNPNVVMLPTWAMLGWLTFKTFLRPTTLSWALVGACAALALLAKYESSIVILTLLGALLSTGQGRRALKHRGFVVALVVVVGLLLPHLVWLASHHYLPVHYALGYTGLGSGLISHTDVRHFYLAPPLQFFFEQLAACAPVVLIWGSLVVRNSHAVRLEPEVRRFIHWLAFAPLALLLALAVALHAQPVTRWGFPLFTWLGVYLLALRAPSLTSRKWGALLATLILLQAALFAASWVSDRVLPHWTQRAPHSGFDPAPELAALITDEWHVRMRSKLPYVAGSERFLVSGVCTYSKDRPQPFFEWAESENPWLEPANLAHKGMAIVGRSASPDQDAVLLQEMSRRYPTLTGAHPVILRYPDHSYLAPARYWVAYVPPTADPVR